MLKFLLPHKVKLIITMDDIRLNTNLTTSKTEKFSKKFFFYKNLGFNQSHSRPLIDMEGFIQIILES